MKKKVLFLCRGNSCHSQMAEGLLKYFYGNEYEVFSAGINPVDVDKNTINVMKEIGIDISEQTSKHINKFFNQKFDVIITFDNSKEEKYLTFLNAVQKLEWKLFDPAEALETQEDLIKAFRELRDEIKIKIIDNFKTN